MRNAALRPDIERDVDERLNELVRAATVLGPATPIAIKAFTGREWDPETGLYYYRARYYDPKAGRFISADPIGFEGGVNFFGYVGGNPVRFRDPLGLYLPGEHHGLLHSAFGFQSGVRQLIDGAQYIDDNFQGSSNAYMHAMSDGVTGESAAAAQRRAKAFIKQQLDAAVRIQDESTAMFTLGMGMHTIMDQFPTGHAGNQPWNGGDGPYEMVDLNGFDRMFAHLLGDLGTVRDDRRSIIRLLREYYDEFQRRRAGQCKR